MSVGLGSSVPFRKRSVTLRTLYLGEFYLSKAKPLLVSTLRGVPFNQANKVSLPEQEERARKL